MSLQLFLGSAGSGKSYQLYQNVINASRENPNTNYLVIVPEQFTLQTQKDIVTMHPEHGVMNVDILSFLRFAFRIFEEVGGNHLPILEDTGKSMVLRKVVAAKKKDMILFASNIKKVGFVNELKSLISELYQYNIGREDFDKMLSVSEKKPLLWAKLMDILTVYEGFQDYMKERYITAEELLVVLNQVIDESDWLRGTVICLDGFTGFTPCQYQILEKLMKYAKKVMITVTIDPREDIHGTNGSENGKDNTKDHELFALSKKTIQKLYQLANLNDIKIEEPVYAETLSGERVPYRFRKAPALAHLERNLYRFPYDVYRDEQQDIRVHHTKDLTGEVNFVAEEIKRLVREEGYRYRDIAVISGSVDLYSDAIRRTFAQLQIPSFIDHKKEILNNPFALLIRSAIGVVAEDFSYESVFRYLRSGMSNLTTEEIDRLENYALATGIRGHKRYSEPFTRRYRNKEGINLEFLNDCRMRLLEELEPLYLVLKNKESNIKDYTTALYEFGVALKVEQKLAQYQRYFREQQMPLMVKEYEQIYSIVMELYDQIVLLLGTECCTLQEYGEIIDTGLVEVKVGLIPPGVDAVVVGDTERTRLKDIRALFLIGVNEGIIPKSLNNGGILSDIERELLINNEIELAPTKRQVACTEQFYIYLNMTKPKERLYVTYHRVNDEGKGINPSFIISKLRQLFPNIKIHKEEEYKNEMEYILRDYGLSTLTEGLRSYQEQEISDQFKELFLFYQTEEERKQILDQLLAGAFVSNEEKGISKEVAKLLYGAQLKGSITRLERYAACAFAHHMSYGLALEERKEFKLAIPDIGNIFHNAIDEFSKRLDGAEYTWHDIPDEVRDDWALECVQSAVEQYESSYLRSTKRNEYLVKRMERITVRTLWALCNQIKQGAFEPFGYEMPFYHIPEDGMSLQGRIDRIDIYEEEDKIFVRVIDYKSGSTFFDINRVYHGLQQQLSVYLSAAMDYMNNEFPAKEVVPAGIFYYHIDDPIVAKSEEREEDIFKSLKMNGLVNKDKQVIGRMDQKLAGPDGNLRPSVKSDIISVETNKEGELAKRSQVASQKQMNSLVNYVNQKLVTDGKKILEGDTTLNPYRMANRTACDYCEYRSICGFDRHVPGYNYRNLAKKTTDELKEEIWGTE